MKPDDIPQGVWDAACEAWMNADLTRMSAWKPVEHIARAIMVEREECAEVVRKLIPAISEDGPENAAHEAEYSALGFAMNAIRSRP